MVTAEENRLGHKKKIGPIGTVMLKMGHPFENGTLFKNGTFL